MSAVGADAPPAPLPGATGATPNPIPCPGAGRYSLGAAAFFVARDFAAAGALAAGRFSAILRLRRALSFFWLTRRRIFNERRLSCLPMRAR